MKRFLPAFVVIILLFSPVKQARADLFGGDVAVLVQILANAFQQLAQLQKILGTGRQNVAMIEDINRGINDSLRVIQTISPYLNPGVYKDWAKVSDALKAVRDVYGIAVPSKDEKIQNDNDQSIAEAVTLNNEVYRYTKDIDAIAESIKNYSHQVSPGGAQKLTAQSLGIMLNVMNQGLRTQATGLKIQAQTLALQNHKDKEYTKHWLESTSRLGDAMQAQDTSFSLPRF